MELIDFGMLGLVSGAFSLVFSLICAYGTLYLRDRRVSVLERDVESLIMRRNNELSQESRVKRGEQKAKEDEVIDAALGAIISKVMIEGKKFEDLKSDPSMAQHAQAIPLIIKRYAKEV